MLGGVALTLPVCAGWLWVTFVLEQSGWAGLAGLLTGVVFGALLQPALSPNEDDTGNFVAVLIALGVTLWAMFWRHHAAIAGLMGVITSLLITVMSTGSRERHEAKKAEIERERSRPDDG